MTDAMLEWQTTRFVELADGPTDGYVVKLRPEQVVEIAFDGVQGSSRYPGGMALRFARVLRGDERARTHDRRKNRTPKSGEASQGVSNQGRSLSFRPTMGQAHLACDICMSP